MIRKTPRYPVEASHRDRKSAERRVIALLNAAGFIRIGQSKGRLMHTEGGKPVQMNDRKRYENSIGFRVTVGIISTYFYRVNDVGDADPIAHHKTLDLKAIKRTIAGVTETTETVTIVYFNDRFRRQESMERPVPNLRRPTIEAAIDIIEGKFGTVLTVHHHNRLLHRSMVKLKDLMS